MIVRLPREARGEWLIKVIQKAAEALKPDGYVVQLSTEDRYEPGSVKRVIDKAVISVFKVTTEIKRSGFLWMKKEVVPKRWFPEYIFCVASDNKYKELSVKIVCAFDFPERPDFEKFVAALYQQFNLIEA